MKPRNDGHQHSATLLPDGRVLIVGGWAREGTTPIAEAEMFDPTTGSFQPAGTLQGGATLLPGGRVLIAGDAGVEFFDPATGSLTAGPAITKPRHAVGERA